MLKRVHALARVARDNSPDPHYISRLPTSWGITHRLREQVVKIINQVRAMNPGESCSSADPVVLPH